jgi:branched-chain amino acid transport system ATP-binding protein
LIATHRTNPSSFGANLFMLASSRAHDERGARRVREALEFLGIAEHADRKVAGMPFGLMRLVELARALVSDPTLVLLDEPASGLDVRETETLAGHITRIRDEMDTSLLLIEHDMSLVMDVSDHVYVLDFGRNLADGSGEHVRANPAVVAAYLGEESVA